MSVSEKGASGMSKILLVEGNGMNRDMLSRRLQRRGYEVIITVDGQEGVSAGESPSDPCSISTNDN